MQFKATVSRTQSSQASLTTTDMVRTSVFQYQIAHFGHDFLLENKLYFVGLDEGSLHDPSPAVMQNLKSPHYRVKAISQCTQNAKGTFDKKTKEIGLEFVVTKIRFLSSQDFPKATVEGGIFNGPWGHSDIFTVELIKGVWKVTRCDIQVMY